MPRHTDETPARDHVVRRIPSGWPRATRPQFFLADLLRNQLFRAQSTFPLRFIKRGGRGVSPLILPKLYA